MFTRFQPAALCERTEHIRGRPIAVQACGCCAVHNCKSHERLWDRSPLVLLGTLPSFVPSQKHTSVHTQTTRTHAHLILFASLVCSAFSPLALKILPRPLALNRIDRRRFSEESQQPSFDPVVPSRKKHPHSLSAQSDELKRRRDGGDTGAPSPGSAQSLS